MASGCEFLFCKILQIAFRHKIKTKAKKKKIN